MISFLCALVPETFQNCWGSSLRPWAVQSDWERLFAEQRAVEQLQEFVYCYYFLVFHLVLTLPSFTPFPLQSCHRYWVPDCKTFVPGPWVPWWEDPSRPPSSRSHLCAVCTASFIVQRTVKQKWQTMLQEKLGNQKPAYLFILSSGLILGLFLPIPPFMSSDPRSPRHTEALLIFLKPRSTQQQHNLFQKCYGMHLIHNTLLHIAL